MTHTLTFPLPMDDMQMQRLQWFKQRALHEGFAVTSSYEPGLARNDFTPRLFVRVEKPETHIAVPIGQLMAWGVVQCGQQIPTTDTPARRPAAA